MANYDESYDLERAMALLDQQSPLPAPAPAPPSPAAATPSQPLPEELPADDYDAARRQFQKGPLKGMDKAFMIAMLADGLAAAAGGKAPGAMRQVIQAREHEREVAMRRREAAKDRNFRAAQAQADRDLRASEGKAGRDHDLALDAARDERRAAELDARMKAEETAAGYRAELGAEKQYIASLYDGVGEMEGLTLGPGEYPADLIGHPERQEALRRKLAPYRRELALAALENRSGSGERKRVQGIIDQVNVGFGNFMLGHRTPTKEEQEAGEYYTVEDPFLGGSVRQKAQAEAGGVPPGADEDTLGMMANDFARRQYELFLRTPAGQSFQTLPEDLRAQARDAYLLEIGQMFREGYAGVEAQANIDEMAAEAERKIFNQNLDVLAPYTSAEPKPKKFNYWTSSADERAAEFLRRQELSRQQRQTMAESGTEPIE